MSSMCLRSYSTTFVFGEICGQFKFYGKRPCHSTALPATNYPVRGWPCARPTGPPRGRRSPAAGAARPTAGEPCPPSSRFPPGRRRVKARSDQGPDGRATRAAPRLPARHGWPTLPRRVGPAPKPAVAPGRLADTLARCPAPRLVPWPRRAPYGRAAAPLTLPRPRLHASSAARHLFLPHSFSSALSSLRLSSALAVREKSP
jgi:hypothetical protein